MRKVRSLEGRTFASLPCERASRNGTLARAPPPTTIGALKRASSGKPAFAGQG